MVCHYCWEETRSVLWLISLLVHTCSYLQAKFNVLISQSVTSNVSEVPGGLAHQYASQEAAQAAYDEALNGGQVIEVMYNISKHVLTPPSNQPE